MINRTVLAESPRTDNAGVNCCSLVPCSVVAPARQAGSSFTKRFVSLTAACAFLLSLSVTTKLGKRSYLSFCPAKVISNKSNVIYKFWNFTGMIENYSNCHQARLVKTSKLNGYFVGF